MHRLLLGPMCVAAATLAAVLATIASDANGPGVTCDEPYHVYHGKLLLTALINQGPAFFLPDNIERNFDWPAPGPPVQAPLGQFLLGVAQFPFDPAPSAPEAVSIVAARLAPAAAFALLVFIVGVWTGRRAGGFAGTAAAAALALMPRAFGHAHLAALDTLTTLFFVAAMLAAADAARGGRTWHFALAGIVWGAAMLVRLHGVLLAPPVVAWLFWLYRPRPKSPGRNGWFAAIVPFLKATSAWGAAGMATLFVGWPWLWLAPIPRLWRYFASGSNRLSLHVFYQGQIWADRDAPWHYPWVMFAVTVPLGLLLLGCIGLFGGKRQQSNFSSRDDGNRCRTQSSNILRQEKALPAMTFVFILGLFSWPGVPVYDGVRLFLMVFPIWAIFVGLGAAWLMEHPSRFLGRRRLRLAAVGLFMAAQGIGLLLYMPCHLSYYNLLTGGLAGAERLGFEVTYWGDSVREPLLSEAAARSPGGPIIYAPNLAQFQALAATAASPALINAKIELIEFSAEQPPPKNCRYAIVYNRRADPAEVNRLLACGRVVAEYKLQGVWLARLVELTAPIDLPGRGGTMDGLP